MHAIKSMRVIIILELIFFSDFGSNTYSGFGSDDCTNFAPGDCTNFGSDDCTNFGSDDCTGFASFNTNCHPSGYFNQHSGGSTKAEGKPHLLLAHTVKGKGLPFAENRAEWHHHVPNEEQLQQAYEALGVKGVEWA